MVESASQFLERTHTFTRLAVDNKTKTFSKYMNYLENVFHHNRFCCPMPIFVATTIKGTQSGRLIV